MPRTIERVSDVSKCEVGEMICVMTVPDDDGQWCSYWGGFQEFDPDTNILTLSYPVFRDFDCDMCVQTYGQDLTYASFIVALPSDDKAESIYRVVADADDENL